MVGNHKKPRKSDKNMDCLLTMKTLNSKICNSRFNAHVAQSVEHLHGKQEVIGSIPIMSSS